ncbi:MAG: thioesterase family protein [Bacteroidales bacterium]|jgi:predicted thioesterase|nr:thioesterase family protein [Bacteroidales bacterium]
MNNNIQEGKELELTSVVKDSDTARVYGSGLLDVYSTPAMVAFMEKTSMELVQAMLDEGYGTVGIALDIKHMKAVPVGGRIRCISRLSAVEGNKLTFRVEVKCDSGLVGEGTHSRYIIEEKRFLSKINK